MRLRLIGFALLSILISASLMAAAGSYTFYLATQVRAGKVQLPRGICEVTWKAVSGSQVTLTIKTDDQKIVAIPARMIPGKHDETGVVTSVVNGVTYLEELRTKDARFMIQNRIDTSK